MVNAQVKEMPWINSGDVMPSWTNDCSSKLAKAGSPTQPKPSEAKVAETPGPSEAPAAVASEAPSVEATTGDE